MPFVAQGFPLVTYINEVRFRIGTVHVRDDYSVRFKFDDHIWRQQVEDAGIGVLNGWVLTRCRYDHEVRVDDILRRDEL